MGSQISHSGIFFPFQKLVYDIGRLINTDYWANVLDGEYRGFKKARFNPAAPLNVNFAGECGIDNKGLTQEFLTLALAAIKNSPVLAGENHECVSSKCP